jgi:hypothetical protein
MQWESQTAKLETACGNMYVTTIFSQDKEPRAIKVLPSFGKGGSCAQLHTLALCELLSYIIEKENPVPALSKLVGHVCHLQKKCCIDVLARHLLKFYLQKER